MIAMRAIFKTQHAEHFVFKGGTSLSKTWKIIERFSEDIDLAIDRKFLGYEGILGRKQVTKLRKASCSFVVDEFQYVLSAQLAKDGMEDFQVNVVDFERSDTDPLAIELNYKSLTSEIDYLKPRILIELSSRSLIKPFEGKDMISFIGETFPHIPFADRVIKIPTALPSRTMLEKIFLLHEEFQRKPQEDIRNERMTRHFYDLVRLMDTPHLEIILRDKELYDTIVSNREMLLNISWVNYSLHQPATINFIPPEGISRKYRDDYIQMQESMIYGETLSYEELMIRLKNLNNQINSIQWK